MSLQANDAITQLAAAQHNVLSQYKLLMTAQSEAARLIQEHKGDLVQLVKPTSNSGRQDHVNRGQDAILDLPDRLSNVFLEDSANRIAQKMSLLIAKIADPNAAR